MVSLISGPRCTRGVLAATEPNLGSGIVRVSRFGSCGVRVFGEIKIGLKVAWAVGLVAKYH